MRCNDVLDWLSIRQSGRVVQRIATGRGTDGVAVGAGSVWVVSGIDGQVARIDPASGRISQHIDVGSGLREVAVGPGGVWVTRDAV